MLRSHSRPCSSRFSGKHPLPYNLLHSSAHLRPSSSSSSASIDPDRQGFRANSLCSLVALAAHLAPHLAQSSCPPLLTQRS